MRSGSPPTISRWISSLALAVALVLCAAAPAQAAFPGTPGPLVYPRQIITGEDLGGLVIHGPRQRQKPHRLTNNGSDDTPSFSADGRTIVFSGNRDPGAATDGVHIYTIEVNGSGLKQLTSGNTFDRNPSFSPSGQRVVFDRRVGGKSHIFAVNVDGSGLRQLTKGNGNDTEPVYMPNGKRILFSSDRDRDAETDRSDIFAIAPSGADPRVLIDGPRKEYEADPSPNGLAIAFVSNRTYGINIFVAGSNGRHIRQLTHNHRDCFSGGCNLSPAWAPDGKHIAFLSVGRFSSDLEVMRADGTGTKEFANGSTEEEGLGTKIGPPSWGPVRP
jgi:Tol biopolymer transport system component